MKVKNIIEYIEKRYPNNSQLDFDNSGANIVNFDDEVKGILVCLDITRDAIEYASRNSINLIISHHPIIFNEIRNIIDDPISKRIKLLLKYGINAYSMHTNFDANLKYGMGILAQNQLFGKKEIKKEDILEKYKVCDKNYGIGNIIYLNKPKKLNTIYNLISKKFNIDIEKMVLYSDKENKDIEKIIIVPGSGSSDVNLVLNEGADLFITSEIKHNQIIDLLEEGISYINATHYGFEKIFIDCIYRFLKLKFKLKIVTYFEEKL